MQFLHFQHFAYHTVTTIKFDQRDRSDMLGSVDIQVPDEKGIAVINMTDTKRTKFYLWIWEERIFTFR